MNDILAFCSKLLSFVSLPRQIFRYMFHIDKGTRIKIPLQNIGKKNPALSYAKN